MWHRVDVFTIALCLSCWWSVAVFGRQFSKCEFADEMRNYFAEEEIAAWTCIAQFESEFKTDAINTANSDGSSDHGIFQINDRYWCGQNSGSNTCGVECPLLRREDLSESVRCAQIVKDKQGFSAWAVWPRCKSQTASYLDECNGQSFLPPTIFDIQVRPANRGPSFNQTRITSSLRSFQQARNQESFPAYSSFNDSRSFNLSSFGGMDFLGGGRFLFKQTSPTNLSLTRPVSDSSRYRPLLSNVGGMNFLGGVQISRRTYPSLGHLHKSGGMSFLGFPGSRFAFDQGSQLSASKVITPVPKLNNFRYSGILNSMTLIGHAYEANYPAPVKGFIYRTGQGILADQGAMNFLGGVGGVAFRRQTSSKPPRTVLVPSVQPLRVNTRPKVQQSFRANLISTPLGSSQLRSNLPLQHFRPGSLLDQIPPLPPTTSYVYREPEISNDLISNRHSTTIGDPGATKNVEVSDYLINFGGAPPRQQFQTSAIPVQPRIRSSKLPHARSRQFTPSTLNPSPISSLFQKGTVHRSVIPQTSQVQGPVLSYSTGNMFFSLGTNAVNQAPSPHARQSLSAFSGNTYTHNPPQTAFKRSSPDLTLLRNTQRQASLTQRAPTAVLNSPQTQFRLDFPQAKFTHESRQAYRRNAPSRVTQSTLPPKATFTITSNSPTYNVALSNNKRRTAYGYQPQSAIDPFSRISNARTATSTIPARTNAFQGSVRGRSFGNVPFQPLGPIGQLTSPPQTRVSSSQLSSPARRFSTVETPIQSRLFAGFPQQVQAHMPEGYGGISYIMSNGVMTMVKHYG